MPCASRPLGKQGCKTPTRKKGKTKPAGLNDAYSGIIVGFKPLEQVKCTFWEASYCGMPSVQDSFARVEKQPSTLASTALAF
jgi:hypothetical protein